jgi:hypothetical protein
MALNPYLTQAVGKAALDSIVDTLDAGGAGTSKFYGTAQAATANTATSGQTLLAELAYGATAFGAATTADPSVATANAITSDSSANATATVVWARHAGGGGTTVFDCSAGISSGTFDIEFNTDAFVTGATVAISALTVTLPLHV